ncbi:MAG: ABC transporter substrate-binding protein [Acidimicrobiales bacterium]|nr:ABC transporter substrate-binding protein [Acidimicrobiales bacterium]
MTRTTMRSAAVLLTIALALAGCGDDNSVELSDTASNGSTSTTSSIPEPAFPVTVTADNGDVSIAVKPTTIVSLSPSITEMLYAVGASDQVAAVDASSNFPADAPVTDLSGFRPNVEAIGALAPDLVFLARDRDDVVATLEDVGLTVVLLEAPESLVEVYDQIETVAAATGHADAGAQVAGDVESGINALLADVTERGEPLTYFYELTSDYNTLTSDTFVGSLLSLAGLENIADGVAPGAGSYPQLTAEYVLDTNPDVVFIAHADGSVPTDDELAARAGWAELTAVVEGHIVALDPDIASRWGPRIVELLDAVLEATAGIG